MKLIAAISALAAIPALAHAQQGGPQPNIPKPTKADAQSVVEIVTTDKAKTQAYCGSETGIMAGDPWHYYSRALDSYADQLGQLDYAGVAPKLPKPQRRTQGFFTVEYLDGPLTSGSIKLLLSENAVGPPHGFELLKPLPLPDFPKFPQSPEISPPIQKPKGGFSIFGSPWRPIPALQGQYLEIIEKESKLREKTANLRTQFEQKYSSSKSATRHVAGEM